MQAYECILTNFVKYNNTPFSNRVVQKVLRRMIYLIYKNNLFAYTFVASTNICLDCFTPL